MTLWSHQFMNQNREFAVSSKAWICGFLAFQEWQHSELDVSRTKLETYLQYSAVSLSLNLVVERVPLIIGQTVSSSATSALPKQPRSAEFKVPAMDRRWSATLMWLGRHPSELVAKFSLHPRFANTPWKINMEPTNHPFRKENDLPNLHDYGPC